MKVRVNGSSGIRSIPLTLCLGGISFLAILAALRWGTTIWHYRGTGVDVTDEGYYLSSVMFPNKIPHAPTDFAFYLRPLWIISGQNLANYRVAGFLLILLASTYFSLELTRWIHIERSMLRWATRGLLALVTTAGLSYQYVLWIPTPNYNILGLCLLICSATAIMSMARQSDAAPLQSRGVNWTPIATSGFLLFTLFATRVTAGLLVALLFLVIWWQFGYLKALKTFAVEISVGVFTGVILHSLLTLRPPWKSAQSWSKSLELSKLRKDHANKVLWEFDFLTSHVRPWLWWFLALIVAVIVIRRFVSHDGLRSLIAFGSAIVTANVMWESRPSGGLSAVTTGVGWWWLRLTIYGLLISFLISSRLSKKHFLGPMVASLALIGAAGSANGIFHQLIFTAGLFAAGLLVQQIIIARESGWRFSTVGPLTPFLMIFLLLGLSAAQDTIETPYRTVGTIWESTEEVSYGTFGSMRVHPNSASYARWSTEIRGALPPNIACVVNLEGATPSLAPLIDVAPAGTNWNLGGYPGSIESSNRSLELDTCWKDNPFLLIDAPTGDNSLPVPVEIRSLCKEPFTTFELRTDHSASMQASLCNQPED